MPGCKGSHPEKCESTGEDNPAGAISTPYRVYRRQSSSASLLTAGAAGFLLLIQSNDRPER